MRRWPRPSLAAAVADRQHPAPPAGVEDRLHRAGVHLVARPRAGQDADPAVVRKCVAHRGPAQPAALQAEVRPPQSRRGLTVQEQVDTTGPGIKVDQQRRGRGLGQSRGEDRCARTAPATDHRDHPPVAGTSAGFSRGIGEVAGQQLLLCRQCADVLRANGLSRPARSTRCGSTAAHQDQPGPARHSLAAAGCRLVENHRRHRRPRLSRQRRGRRHHPEPYRCRHSLDCLPQLGVVEHGQHGVGRHHDHHGRPTGHGRQVREPRCG